MRVLKSVRTHRAGMVSSYLTGDICKDWQRKEDCCNHEYCHDETAAYSIKKMQSSWRSTDYKFFQVHSVDHHDCKGGCGTTAVSWDWMVEKKMVNRVSEFLKLRWTS